MPLSRATTRSRGHSGMTSWLQDGAIGAGTASSSSAMRSPERNASNRVLEKAGFREEGLALRYMQINGVWEDHKLFAVTVEEWPPTAAVG